MINNNYGIHEVLIVHLISNPPVVGVPTTRVCMTIQLRGFCPVLFAGSPPSYRMVYLGGGEGIRRQTP